MRAKLNVSGMEDYLQRLVDAEKDVDAVADEALLAAGQILYAEIEKRIPVETGNLREHLVVNGPVRKDNKHFVYVEIDMRDREQMLYAVYVEYGRAKKGAHPYIRPGVRAAKPLALQAMAAVFQKYLDAL